MRRSTTIAALALLGAACADQTKTSNKPPARALLDTLSRGSTTALETCLLEGDFEGQRFLVALQRPNHMRLEVKSAGETSIALRRPESTVASPGRGPNGARSWQAVSEEAKTKVEALRLLLGSVLGWDLLDTGSDGGTNPAKWFRATDAPIIHREFDAQGTLTTLQIEGERWAVVDWHEDHGARVPELRDRNGRELRFDRVSLASRFLDGVFEPREQAIGVDGKPEPSSRVPGFADPEAELNFETPLLERVTAAKYIEAEVGEGWEARMAVLSRLGEALGALGQGAVGLPAYVDGRRVRIHIKSNRPDGRILVPEGYKVHDREEGLVLVLHHKSIAFDQAQAALEPRIRAHAAKEGFVLEGPVLVLPYALPSEAGLEDGALVQTRVEIRAR